MLVSQAEAGLDGSNIQQGQKCARATLWGTFVWLLPPSPTGWRFVLFMLSQNQPWIPPCQCTNIASAPVKVVFPLSACTHWLVDKFCFVLLFFFLVKMRLPVFFTVTTLPWICIFVFLFFCFSVHLVRHGTEGSLTFTHNTVPHTTPNRTPTLSKERCKVLSTFCWNANLPDEETPTG